MSRENLHEFRVLRNGFQASWLEKLSLPELGIQQEKLPLYVIFDAATRIIRETQDARRVSVAARFLAKALDMTNEAPYFTEAAHQQAKIAKQLLRERGLEASEVPIGGLSDQPQQGDSRSKIMGGVIADAAFWGDRDLLQTPERLKDETIYGPTYED